jgi:hypothetical protein
MRKSLLKVIDRSYFTLCLKLRNPHRSTLRNFFIDTRSGSGLGIGLFPSHFWEIEQDAIGAKIPSTS